MRGMREMARITAISVSPILSFFTEIARGAFYCRSCVSEKFITKVLIL